MADGVELTARHPETALLTAAFDAARRSDRQGSAVHLRGEAGVGKTALLDWAAACAEDQGFSVLRAEGVQAEEGTAFGALHQILRPLTHRLDVLPRRWREALDLALGLGTGPAQGGLLVGAAALALLADATRKGPLLILLDDLQWVDASSATVFAFLHRRIAELPLVVVSAGRPGGPAAGGWAARVVDIGPLTPSDAEQLLRRRHPGLATATVEYVLAEAVGNPLALVELPHQLDPGPGDDISLSRRTPLRPGLERLFLSRLTRLSPEAARVLLLVALGGGTAAWNVGSWLRTVAGDRADEVLDDIEAGGLAQVDPVGRLVFRHPLVRTAVIAWATEAQQRAAHRELAVALGPDDPRRPIHEAAATTQPDDRLAARLQEAGRALSGRGGDAEGALLLYHAGKLSTDAEDRARRLTWAAVMAARGGRLAFTASLVEELRRGTVPADIAPLFAYAVVYVDHSHLVDFTSSFTLLPKLLDSLAETPDTAFPGLAEQVYFKLLLAASYTDDTQAWRALAKHRHHMSPTARLCHQVWADPARTAHGASGELARIAAGPSEEQGVGSAWLVLWTATALDMADAPLRRRFLGQHSYATQGSIAKAKARQDYLHGHWDQAEVCLREATTAAELGYHCNALLLRHLYAHFLAGRGDEAGLREIALTIEPLAARAGMVLVQRQLAHLHALAALAHGRYEEAYTALRAVMPPGELPRGLPWFQLPFLDFVYAAVRTGRSAEARAHLAAAREARMAEISPHHAFLLAAAGALAAPDDEADDRYGEAYAVPGAEQWIFEMARLRLADGERLRRAQSLTARDALGAAHRTFRSLGALPWAERAERELRSAGHPVRAPGDRPGLLTAQELRIARLAADGLTNKEIGSLLRLSPRTVSGHLYRIFPKLGISSRAALAWALGED
ncbi:AAA family ATPase [Streptomyces sp. NPDC091271]|uniref:helix-turn-helix transcriptional regulator n=1 Tax=Streptomyces sp. NPDC091271 TaxID=3365980 RepID=UPI0038014344